MFVPVVLDLSFGLWICLLVLLLRAAAELCLPRPEPGVFWAIIKAEAMLLVPSPSLLQCRGPRTAAAVENSKTLPE